ncbi:OmpA family protein [Rubricoccus marinus]|uniref:OmpA-like domain-containing protein n=1 Tax=Rubricoccus marinus TaxID=716817 RepID=A0A259TW80_9BACT|nr:OmpA family protein [Rubricoccus marinus]OZC01877.1 hypothetical protein BSZ36_02060 [Rubricoccus marinus]
MTHRLSFPLFLIALLMTSVASAQVIGTRYDTDGGSSGVRIGIGVGASVYNGPNTLYPLDNVVQENVTEVKPAVTAFVGLPLGGDRLYGRLLAGLLNIGADSDNEIARQGGNPFLTNEQALAEVDLLFNLASPRTSSVVPYVYTGIGAIIADPFGRDDVADALDRDRVAYVLPVGIGVDLNLSRNLSLFGEASYRFPLNNVGQGARVAADFFELCDGDPDCIAKCEADPTDPACVLGDGDSLFDTKFGSALLTGGLRLGFGARSPAPVEYIPPVPTREVIVERETIYVEPEPLVCDLVELNSIYFDHGSSSLSMRAQDLLGENVELLLDNSACCVFLDAYTDTSEHDRFGMGLAGRRAQAVYDYYLTQGVAASRLQIRNRGVASPSCDKEDPGVGCSRNRRVDSVPMDCERFRLMLENGGQ